MANVTDPLVSQLCGTDPQNLMEYITRQKIYDSRYWKEECFGLSVVDVLEKSAQSLQCIGGLPCHFLSLTLKLLQLHPDHDIVRKAFIEQDTFKYTRAIGCLYIRLTSRPTEVYTTLEPLLQDYRKLRIWTGTNQNRWDRTTVDQFVYDLLQTTSSSSSSSLSISPPCNNIAYLGITIPRLPSRKALQESGYIPDGPRLVSSIPTTTTRLPKLHRRLLEYMTLHSGVVPVFDSDDTVTTEQYGQAALNYLKFKAKEQKNPTAIKVYEQRQLRPEQQQFLDTTVERTTTANKTATTTASTMKVTRNDDRQQNAIPPPPPSITASEEPSATTTTTKTSTNVSKKRNYGSLFKNNPINTGTRPQQQPPIAAGMSTTTTTAINTTNNNSSNNHSKNNDSVVRNEGDDSEQYWNAERAKLGLKPLKK